MTKRTPFSLTKHVGSGACLVLALLFLVFFLASLSLAQGPDTLWTRTFGGSDNDYAYSIQQTSDGGYIVAGNTYSFGSGGAFLFKLDSMGDSLWMRVYDGVASTAYAVSLTMDGGYIITGMGGILINSVYLLRTDDLGDTLWTKAYEGVRAHYGTAVRQTTDGGYVVTGQGGGGYFPDIALIKTDSLGDTLWTRCYGGGGLDQAWEVQQTADGGYIIAGNIVPFAGESFDFYLVKTDANGDSLWTRTYGGSEDEWGYALDQTADGGYVIAGIITPVQGDDDMYVVRTDNEGDTLWTRTYGGSDSDGASGIEQTEDGGFIIGGGTDSYGDGTGDVYLVKINALGDTVWTRTYGSSNHEGGTSVRLTSDGGYVVVGSSVAVDAWDRNIYVVKTGPDLAAASRPLLPPDAIALYQNYPNPFNASTRIAFDLPKGGPVTLKVFDLLGREVATLVDGVRTQGHHSILFDGSNLPSGIYFYRLEMGSVHEAKKMVLLK